MFYEKDGYRLEAIRRFINENRVINPLVVHSAQGYTFYFDLIEGDNMHTECVLITLKTAKPRAFKKATTYTRFLKSLGITKWKLERV